MPNTPPPRNSRNKRVNNGRKNGPVLYMDANGYIYLAFIKTNRLGVHPNRVEYVNLTRPAPPYNANAWKKHFKPASPKRKRNNNQNGSRRKSPRVSN